MAYSRAIRMRQAFHFLASSCCLFFIGRATAAVYDVRDFGARGDGHSVDTVAVQKAIDACAAANGGVVRFSAGTYLSKPLSLHGNNLTVQLESNAVLQGTPEFADYDDGAEVVGLITANRMTNFSIVGEGVIDGAGQPWWPDVRKAKRDGTREPRRRPKMINIRHCAAVKVAGVTLRNSPSFHLVPTDCEDVWIDSVTIQAPGDSPNTDAIDPSSCRNVRIVNCLLDVGDDNVALKAGHPAPGRAFACEDILVSNCTCLHGHGISIGSETSAGVSNFTVVNCRFDGTVSGIRIKTTREKGGPVEDIHYRNLTMNNVRRPIDIACYYPKVPANDSARPRTATTPSYHGISIDGLRGNCPEIAGLIVGLPESPVRSLQLSNIQLKSATGLLIENAEDVEVKNVHIEAAQGPPLILKNAKVH